MEKLITMTDDLLTGIKEMDSEHLELVEMINHIAHLLREGKKEEAEEFFVNELSTYVETHLKDEEEFMESIGYPELEAHKKVHEIFRREIYRLLPEIQKGDYKAFIQALAMSWGWLYNHIAKTDKKYGLYAKEKNIV